MTRDDLVFTLVLTGGPCGGKTTSMAHLSELLEGLGYRVFLVPEAATLMMTSGASPLGGPRDRLLFQRNLIKLQMSLEDCFTELARGCGQPAVVLCDRGTMDTSAYLSAELWQTLLTENGWTEVELRDGRYDAVIHLVTAALGAEPFYTTENNTVRHETPEQARGLDERLRRAWVGHPRLRVIDNRADFQDKVRRVSDALCHVIQAPAPRGEIERRFLLSEGAELPAGVHHKTFELEQTYLVSTNGGEARVRSRTSAGASSYTHTVKRPQVAGQSILLQRRISGRDFTALRAQADPERQPVHKQRRCFLWQSLYFELDTFFDPSPGLNILEVKVDNPDEEVELPPFLPIEREITGEDEYMSYNLALRR